MVSGLTPTTPHARTDVPDGFFRILPKYKHGDIETKVLDGLISGQSTVKTISGSIDKFDDSRISVAVTFQACLHLDVSGKVVLFQGVDDVLVRPKG